MNIIDQLVDAAYDTGYYSGKGEDGDPLHNNAILRRERLRHEVLDLTRQQSPEVKALVDAASSLLEAARAEYEDTDWTVAQWVTDEPTVAVLDAALAALKVPE